MKILVAYDGTMQSKEALAYGIEKAREKGGEMIALHVFNNRMFVDYDATPKAESTARAESARMVEEAKAIIREKGAGVKTSLYVGDGMPEEEVISFARAEHVDTLLCPPRFRSIITKYRKMLGKQGAEAGETDLFDEARRLKLAVLSVPKNA